MPEFIGIANQYNDMNGTDLTLDQEGIIGVHTLVETGVNANSLLNAQSYREILSGKGYWVLPLRDSQGAVEMLLNVNAINADNEELDVSGNNFEYGSDGQEYLAAIQPSGDVTARENEILFDLESLKNLVLDAGYKTISEIVIADINDGMDFLVFAQADGAELAVPCFTNSGLFGLENNKVYARDELFEIIGNNMLH